MNAGARRAASPLEILQARAERLARPATPEPGADRLPVLQFSLHVERYAFPLAAVSEVVQLGDVTPLPGTPAFVAGIANLRGRFVAVVNLRRFLGLPEQGILDLHHLVVIREGAIEVAVLADLVAGLREVELGALQPAGPTVTPIEARFVIGLTPDGVCVLDPRRILGEPRLRPGSETPA